MTLHKTIAYSTALLAALALNSDAISAADVPQGGISVDEAKSLVAQIAEVATEFRHNSSCSIQEVSPASERACQFYMLHAICAPTKTKPGLSRNLSVNKANGDIEPIDRSGNQRVVEPAVLRAQQRILAAHGITEQAASVARAVFREGCMYR